MLPVKLLQSLLFLHGPVTHLHIQSYHYWGSWCIVFHSASVMVKIGRGRGDEKGFRDPKGSSRSRLGCCTGVEISFFFMYYCVWKAKPPLPSSTEKTWMSRWLLQGTHPHFSDREKNLKASICSHWLHIEGCDRHILDFIWYSFKKVYYFVSPTILNWRPLHVEIKYHILYTTWRPSHVEIK